MSVGRLIVRVVIGSLFVGHGAQKLFGWFGGSGLDGTDRVMAATQMYPVRPNSIAAGLTEAGCGALLVAGIATPAAAAGLIGVMTTAIRTVHGKNGPWNSNSGWEYNAVIIAALTALVDSGPGSPSFDAARGRVRSGPGWALGALIAGMAASTLATQLGRRNAPRSGEADEAVPSDAAA
ncbi:DoxX family protein [Glaciibacter psychrotolerans]|uniref:DoxX family protein n=1 Tax=Glaciibacter psychrotolerans TaxID=670054 RepID=UPI0015CC9EB0|nr:DoxX family protein [Leifsonia psychrotolerans]